MRDSVPPPTVFVFVHLQSLIIYSQLQLLEILSSVDQLVYSGGTVALDSNSIVCCVVLVFVIRARTPVTVLVAQKEETAPDEKNEESPRHRRASSTSSNQFDGIDREACIAFR